MDQGSGPDRPSGEAEVTLRVLPERRLIRPGGSIRHVDFHIHVSPLRSGGRSTRKALSLALVLDRSGSMAGDKLTTAKRAARAVIERLDDRDQLAVVVFDDHIDVLQPVAGATAEVKARVAEALERVEARASTALHEAWLTGCREIAAETPAPSGTLGRCFLLTDGLANQGVTDPEQIAGEAASIRERAGIGTSTFGVGPDYNESLLAPLAVAGGGQFHHLRTAQDTVDTFVGELGTLFAVVANQVRIEIETAPGIGIDLVSAYRLAGDANAQRHIILVGDLGGAETRHLIARFDFPPGQERDAHSMRARVVWQSDAVERHGLWQEADFTYAGDKDCDAEGRDQSVMHWVGLHHADRALRESSEMSRRGDRHNAEQLLRRVSQRIGEYAGDDLELRAAQRELADMQRHVVASDVDPMLAKEIAFRTHTRSRGQRDFRLADTEPPPKPEVGVAGLSPHEDAAKLVEKYLLSHLDWPSPITTRPSESEVRDLCRGSLLWGAVGDALGRAVEGQSPREISARYGSSGLRDYMAWPGWLAGPKGTITDDTQLTMEVARTLLGSPQRFDSTNFARRLVAWLPAGRGKGRATTEAVERLARGEPWWLAGLSVDSAGNGAAMRAAPVGLARALRRTPWPLRRDAVLSAFPTHTNALGVAGAAAMAAGVALCLRHALSAGGQFDKRAFLDFISRAIVETEPAMERRPGGQRVWLGERIRELADVADSWTPEEAFEYTHNGAFVLESVPAALYCFLRSPDNPRQAILTAVNGGYDADTVASLTGNLAGAWCGAERLQREAPEWWADLEYRDELVSLGDGLAKITIMEESLENE